MWEVCVVGNIAGLRGIEESECRSCVERRGRRRGSEKRVRWTCEMVRGVRVRDVGRLETFATMR